MFKSLLLSLLLASVAAFAQTKAPSNTESYVYVPDPDFQVVEPDHIMVKPKKPADNEGAFQACGTLRGKGMIAIGIGTKLIFIAIDCPEQVRKDT